MKKTIARPLFLSIIALAMTVSISLLNIVRAETPSRGNEVREENTSAAAEPAPRAAARRNARVQDQRVQPTNEDVRRTLSDLLSVLPEFVPNFPEYKEAVAKLKQDVLVLQDEHLAAIGKSLDVRRLSEAVGQLNILALERGAHAAGKTDDMFSAGRKQRAKGTFRPSIVGQESHPLAKDTLPGESAAYGDGSLANCGSNRSDTPTMKLLLSIMLVLEGELIPLDVACASVTTIAGNGTTAPFCIAAGVVRGLRHASSIIYEVFAFCDGDIDSIEIRAILKDVEHIHNDLVNSVANDDQNKMAVIDNDNLNKETILARIDSKTSEVTNQIGAGTTDILNRIDAKATDIINNDNTNRTQIVNNDNTNTANIIANANANKTTVIDNANANFVATVNELKALGCDVIRLLHTPEGQRSSSLPSCTGKPGFPYEWTNGASFSTTSATIKHVESTERPSNQRGQDGVPILPIMGTVTMETNLLAGRLIPTYYLPANRGGLIEQVKLMVWNTIEAQTELKIATDDTAQARLFAQEADLLLSAKKYVEAYRQYCLAYQKLVPVN